MTDILIVEDDKELADLLTDFLCEEGYVVSSVNSGERAVHLFERYGARLVVLDINLPDMNGFAICSKLRENTDTPILIVSSRTGREDKLNGYDLGADDYIEKPCSLAVLLAKVKAVLKRCGRRNLKVYSDGWLRVNFAAKQVAVDGRPVKLTALEFKLLAFLMEHEGAVLSKQELFEQVWQDKCTGDGTLNVHIRRLRRTIERNPNQPHYIQTVWGDGYKFEGGAE